jgi:GNAT superfamily N-acetyltransferase
LTGRDPAAWLERNLDGIEGWFRLIAASSESAELIERDGLTALINPACPERSLFNSVVARSPGAIARHRAELARLYAEGGCAWTTWLPEADRDSAAALRGAGHLLDGEPRAMGVTLDEVEPPDLAGVDWDEGASTELMCSISDRAYGWVEGTWLRGMGAGDVGRVYVARIDGRPASTATAVDVGDDCVITCVATIEEARGRGLASNLILQALADARERGRATTTLQASRAGAPVYERLGYRDFGSLQMWELRPPELADA